jgi:hypothetical protein
VIEVNLGAKLAAASSRMDVLDRSGLGVLMDMESSSSHDHILVPLPFPSPLQPARTVGALNSNFDANFETAAESEADSFLANADVPGRATTVTSEKNGHKCRKPRLPVQAQQSATIV